MQRKLTILIADDQLQSRVILRKLVLQEGHEVQEAENGVAVLASVQKSLPDLILLDVMMPVQDGLNTCRILREKYPPTILPIIIVTAKGEESDIISGLQAGANDYVTKPINYGILRARLQAQVRVLEAARAIARAENLLGKKKRLENIGLLASGVAHHFNNLLGTMLTCTELIKHSCSNDKFTQHAVQLMTEAVKRGNELTSGLLTFTRSEENVGQSDVLDILRASIPLVESVSGHRIHYNTHVRGLVPMVTISPSALSQIVLELLRNAVDAIENEGEITITVIGPQQSEQNRPIEDVRLQIRDTGCGISQEIIDHIFKPFFSTKNLDRELTISLDGAGLGLSTAHHLIEQAKGSMEVLQTSPQGTTIELRLPVLLGGATL